MSDDTPAIENDWKHSDKEAQLNFGERNYAICCWPDEGSFFQDHC